MIIFYNKQTKDIFGMINGRIHENVDNLNIKNDNISEELIGKYIVPFKLVYKEIEVPIEKLFIINRRTGEAEKRVIGVEKKIIPNEMLPDVEFSNLIIDFESGKKNIYKYKVLLDNKESVIGFELKV